MKNIIYTLGFITILASCKSINKMVEKGDYDGAFEYAIKKLDGQKKKKTDHVVGLEKAFHRLNEEDLQKIDYLKENPSPRNWDRIESVANNIDRRQALLEPLLPLISEEGYEAYFDMANTEPFVDEARHDAADYYYSKGEDLLTEAKEKNNKYKAQSAYKLFKNADDRVEDYKDTDKKLSESHQLGIMHHLVSVDQSLGGYVPHRLFDELNYLDVSQFNNFWNKYYLTAPSTLSIDKSVVLDIRELIVRPEREVVTYHTDKAKVKDGFRYLKDDDGKILKDSLGNKLKEDKFKHVKAEVTEVYREKYLVLHSELRVVDNANSGGRTSRPLSIEIVFEDYSSSFRGDRRAICGKGHGSLQPYPAAFPSDEIMISDAVGQLKNDFRSALQDI